MSYTSSGFGADAPTQQVYLCTTGACTPWNIAKNCAGDGNRWREMVALNPDKMNASGLVAGKAFGWVTIPGDWQCPAGMYQIQSSGGGAAAPTDPGVTAPPAPPGTQVITTVEHDDGMVVPAIALLAGAAATVGVIYLVKRRRSRAAATA